VRILKGDCRDVLKTLPDESVHCVVTSPPYWGLRDYGVGGQIGLEESPAAWLDAMLDVFQEVHRVLRGDGTAWVNMGDSYATGTTSDRKPTAQGKHGYWENPAVNKRIDGRAYGLKPKDLVGVPWMLAFALRAQGWYLRQDIIWAKPNPMPESVTDRCTKAHEYIFLLSKSERYYFDQDAILEPVSPNTHARVSQDVAAQIGSERAHAGGKTNGNMKAVVRSPKITAEGSGIKNNQSFIDAVALQVTERNKRSVWTVTTQGFKEAHFATFPTELIVPCILAGCPTGGTVLDPFGGAGTTGLVADRHHRSAILIELNPEYAAMAKRRIIGIETASMKCIEWADSCCGGSGAGGEGYRNLGKLLLAMRK
jgi:DNA modification methylase